MKSTIRIRRIDDDYCVVLPKEAIELLDWKQDQVLELFVDETGIEIFDPETVSDEDFQRQVFAAKKIMRKYHVALGALAKSQG